MNCPETREMDVQIFAAPGYAPDKVSAFRQAQGLCNGQAQAQANAFASLMTCQAGCGAPVGQIQILRTVTEVGPFEIAPAFFFCFLAIEYKLTVSCVPVPHTGTSEFLRITPHPHIYINPTP
jgi:hypothetical protein